MKLLILDSRRRVSLAKVGRKSDTRYLVEQFDDGTIRLIPAVTVPAASVAKDDE